MRVRQELADMPEGPARDQAIADIKAQVEKLKDTALKAGGLFVLGTERHESRRIDNQLRGRSGRQGDPGRSKFFLSLEDDLMRIFGSDKLDSMLTKLGLKEGEAIIHPWINKALEKAQQKVEARNFDIRKNILKFDNVMNDQRKVIFDQRVEWMQDAVTADVVSDAMYTPPVSSAASTGLLLTLVQFSKAEPSDHISVPEKLTHAIKMFVDPIGVKHCTARLLCPVIYSSLFFLSMASCGTVSAAQEFIVAP